MPRGINEVGRIEPARGVAFETLITFSAIVAALYLGRTIAIPIAIAILISFSLWPAVGWLRRRHIGRLPAIVITVVPALLALGAFAYVVTIEVGRLAVNIPSYESNIETKVNTLQNSLPSRDMLDRGTAFLRGLSHGSRSTAANHVAIKATRQHEAVTAPAGEPAPIPVEIRNSEPTPVELVQQILGPLVDPLAVSGLVLLFVIFFLAEKESLRDRLIRLAGVKDLHRTTMAMDEAGHRVSRFLLMQTLVNATFGVVIAIGLTIIGLPNAALWGAFAAALRFIPYLGVIVAATLALALAFAVDPGWSLLLWTGGLFLALELVVGNLVEPWLYGLSTGLSAVALIVSAIFWTWLWGAIGLLLATPLTVCIAVVGRHVPQLAFLDILLGNDAPLKPEESFYQRLLAGDPAEATDQADDFIKGQSLGEFFTQVALPALVLAQRDWSRGALDGEHLARVAEGLKDVVADLHVAPAKPSGTGDDSAGANDAEKDSAATDVVLCIAGRTELDEAAAVLLVRMLLECGQPALALGYDAAMRLAPDDLGGRRIKAVCLSYLDSAAAPQARYLTRRIRRRHGADLCIIVAMWTLEQDRAVIEFAAAEARADRVVASLPAAIEAVTTAAAGGRSALEPQPEPTLNDLAAQVATAIARSI